jgi:hypothetical protein
LFLIKPTPVDGKFAANEFTILEVEAIVSVNPAPSKSAMTSPDAYELNTVLLRTSRISPPGPKLIWLGMFLLPVAAVE